MKGSSRPTKLSIFFQKTPVERDTPAEISPIQHKLQITLSENQINKLAEITGFLTRHRKILPYRFNTGCTTLVISLILASFIVVVLKRSLAHAAEQGMDKEISTRKVLMSGTHMFGDLMLALLELNRRHVLRDLKKLLEFWQDRDGAKLLLQCLEGSCKKLRRIWVDGGYRGALLGWVSEQFRFVMQVIMRSDGQKGFHVLPRRWVVERTFAWLNHNRRLCKDYEVLPETSEAMIHLGMIHIMLRRLAS